MLIRPLPARIRLQDAAISGLAGIEGATNLEGVRNMRAFITTRLIDTYEQLIFQQGERRALFIVCRWVTWRCCGCCRASHSACALVCALVISVDQWGPAVQSRRCHVSGHT